MNLEQLEQIIRDRQAERPTESYTTLLFEAGLPRIAQKVGEEATEVVIAALVGREEEVISESADLLYHWLVLLAARNILLTQVLQELAQRQSPTPKSQRVNPV